MDPVCHTLVGATLAEAGLKQRTALGAATLLIAANLPDIDVLAYVDGPYTALWFRRGVTHGVLAWILLPALLTGIMMTWDRLVRRRNGRQPDRAAIPAQILVLAFLGLSTHPILDLLNTYGIRLLMPFSDRWFYGDTLFIVDPWVWGLLALGILLQRRWGRAGLRRRPGGGEEGIRRRLLVPPAAASLVLVSGYVAVMALSNVAARSRVEASAARRGLEEPQQLMVAPVPVNPFARAVVIEIDGRYHVGTWSWFGSELSLSAQVYEREPTDVAAAAATRGPEVRKFLSWARFPYYWIVGEPDERVVYIGDARYTLDPRGGSWAAIAVR